MMGPEFPTTNANTCSSGFTGCNAAATRRATGSGSALWLPLPVSMGLASRWWTTGPASNAGFGFPRPQCRDPSLGQTSLGPRCPFCLDALRGQSQNESGRDADGAGLAIVSLPQPREPPVGKHPQADRRREPDADG